jgi:hypothetical protein
MIMRMLRYGIQVPEIDTTVYHAVRYSHHCRRSLRLLGFDATQPFLLRCQPETTKTGQRHGVGFVRNVFTDATVTSSAHAALEDEENTVVNNIRSHSRRSFWAVACPASW